MPDAETRQQEEVEERLATGDAARSAPLGAGSTEASSSARGRYHRLVLAWVLNNFSDSALIFVIVLWVHEITGSNIAAAFVFAAQSIPVFLAPVAGVLADHLPRAKLMAAANVVAAVGVGVLLVGGTVSSLAIVYAVAFLYGFLGRLVSTANSGLVRDLLSDDDLPSAAGLLSAIDQGMLIVAPLAGVGLYSLLGAEAVVGAVVVGLIVSAVLYLSIATVDSHHTGPIGSARDELMAGFEFLRSSGPLAEMTLLVSLGLGGAGMATAATVQAVDLGLKLPVGFVGVLSSSQGIGSILGGVAAAAVVRRWGEYRTAAMGLALVAAGLATFVAPTLPTVLVGDLAAGLGVTWCVVGATVLRQRSTPGHLQGRVAAATGFLIGGAVAGATVVGASLLGLIGFRAVFGIVVAIATIGALRLFQRSLSPVNDGEENATPAPEVQPT